MSSLDHETIRRAKARDPQALEVFFEHFFDRAYGFAVHLAGNPSLAEDLIQEAFLKMHGAIDRLDPERDPAPWVLTIVRNCARDHWRSRAFKTSQQHTNLEDAWDVATPDAVASPQIQLEKKEAEVAIQQALQTLAPADREVLVLKEYQGMSTAEIAEILDRTPEAVRQRHSRAVKKLAAAYKSRMPNEPRST